MRPAAGSWREQWRQLKLAHCAVPDYGNSKEFWNNKKHVQNVFIKGRENTRHQWDSRLETMNIPKNSRVLDIGAGPGTFAIPLALKGCQVTVVEPSPVMREALNERIAKEHITGISVIPKRWEDVKPEELGDEHYDTIIASYSLTMMDIAEAIAKMQTFCRGSIHLFWFLTPPTWAKVNRDLWPLLHGGEFPGEPLADWLWQVLVEMGIYANLLVEPKSSRTFYSTFDDAVSEYIQRLNCTTPQQEATVKNYLHAMLRQEGDGLVLGDEVLGAHIWWNHQGKPGVDLD
jgi:SAM-dependent methyltransferase